MENETSNRNDGRWWVYDEVGEYRIASIRNRVARENQSLRSSLARSVRRGKGVAVDVETDTLAKDYIKKIEANKQYVKERVKSGITWDGGNIGDNDRHYLPAAHFTGLRSDESPLLKLFVQRTSSITRAGNSPNRLQDFKRYIKTMALDLPYVAGNETMRGYVSVSIKCTFTNLETFLDAVECRGVKMPNLVSFHDGDGQIIDPCMIWLLQNPVLFSETGKVKPKAIYHAVLRGICYRLRDIGAEMSSIDDIGVVKNPCSPLWSACAVEQIPYDLQFLAQGLPTRITNTMLFGSADDLAVEKAIEKILKSQSENPFWKATLVYAKSAVRKHWTGTEENTEKFTADMLRFCKRLGRRLHCGSREVNRVAVKVTSWIWKNHDPKMMRPRISGEGPCAQLTKGKSIRQAQQIGGHYTSDMRRNTAIDKITKSVGECIAQNAKPTAVRIAGMTGQCLRTVKTWLKIAMVNMGLVVPKKVQIGPNVAGVTNINNLVSKGAKKSFGRIGGRIIPISRRDDVRVLPKVGRVKTLGEMLSKIGERKRMEIVEI